MPKVAPYQYILRGEFAKRCDRNSRYSLRAFARALGVEASALSQILSSTRVPSYKMAQKLIKALALSPEETQLFLSSLAEAHDARGLVRMNPEFRKFSSAQGRSTAEEPTSSLRELSLDLFRVIADLCHYSILELTYVEGFSPEPSWIASQLGISAAEAKLAIQRLFDLGLLEKADGTLRKALTHFTTADKTFTDASLRRHQKQVLEKAMHSLENDPIRCRNNTSMTMAIDPEKLPAAKVMIDEFTNRVCAFLESGARKQVYEMSINLFPTQKPSEPKENTNEKQ